MNFSTNQFTNDSVLLPTCRIFIFIQKSHCSLPPAALLHCSLLSWLFSSLLPVYFHLFSYFRVGSTTNFRCTLMCTGSIQQLSTQCLCSQLHPRSSLSWRKHGRSIFNTTWMEDCRVNGMFMASVNHRCLLKLK